MVVDIVVEMNVEVVGVEIVGVEVVVEMSVEIVEEDFSRSFERELESFRRR